MSTYTRADRQHAMRLYKKGWGYLKIANEIGCAASTVRKWVLAKGISPRPVSGYDDEFKKKVMDDYEASPDLSLEKVAKKHGVGAAALSRWLYADGRRVRPYRPRIVSREGIIRDIKAGLPKSEIASRNSCSESWVYQVQRGDG